LLAYPADAIHANLTITPAGQITREILTDPHHLITRVLAAATRPGCAPPRT